MADMIKIDSHLHLYRTAEQALKDKAIYEIFGYGTTKEVHMSALTGTFEEAIAARAEVDIAAAIVLNLYAADWERQRVANRLPEELSDGERERRQERSPVKIRRRTVRSDDEGHRLVEKR